MRVFPQQKIFCVGLNKTGTTSIGDALEILGYTRRKWSPQNANFVLRWHEGKFTSGIEDAIAQHDAFEDLPWPLLFRELDERCPNAKFILTTRSTSAAWLSSFQGHVAGQGQWVGHYLIYGSYDPVADADKHVAVYERHNEAVRAHFADRPGKLLDLCIESTDAWERLCPFLSVPIPDRAFPHSNRRSVSVEP